MKKIFKNRHGNMRSGWMILMCILLFYALNFIVSYSIFNILEKILIKTGDIDRAANYLSPLVDKIYGILSVAMQMVTEIITIAIPIIVWKIMKQRWESLGLRDFRNKFKKDGVIGLLLGFLGCSIIFIILLMTKNVQIDKVNLHLNGMIVWWFAVFMMVGFAEELFNRGLLMSILRKTNNKYVIMGVPSVIFGWIHLMNPHVTFISLINIIFIGFVFSYMYYKSGNLWMCIGYHISWNIFQSVIYGMPVSGMNVNNIITTHYPSNNLLNGGFFGIEGGILTTIMSILLLIFVIVYYRNSDYIFLDDVSTPN